jgi:chitodextrinase
VGSPTTTNYSNTGLSPSTAYSYTVRAVDAAGNESAASNTASATTQAAADTTAPSAPTTLTATAISSTQINLSWTASTDAVGVTGYRVYRGATLVGSPTATNYSNTGLSPSTAYSYTVRAVDAAGNESAASNTASATTQAAPAPPTENALDASWASADMPDTMVVNREATVQITMVNTGTQSWTGADGFALIAVHPTGNSLWGVSVVPLGDFEVIAPGEEKTFIFQIDTPWRLGTFWCDWQMIGNAARSRSASRAGGGLSGRGPSDGVADPTLFGDVVTHTITVVYPRSRW